MEKNNNQDNHNEPVSEESEQVRSDADLTGETSDEAKDEIEENELLPVGNSPASGNGRRRTSLPWVVLSVVLLAALVYVSIANPFSKQVAVAKVNGQKITKDQLYDTMAKTAGKDMLQQLIMNTLIDQQVKKANITVTDKDVEDEISYIKKSFPSEDVFNQALAQQGMTMADLKEQMYTQVKVNKLLGLKIKITEDSMKQFFDQNKDQLGTPEQVRVSQILLQSKEDADAVLKQLKSGSDFAQLAKDKSQDTNSKDKGGDIGFFAKGDMDPAIEDAAFKLKVGETSGVVESQDGYAVIKVTDHKDAVPAKYEDVKDDIHYQLFSQQVSQQFQPWYNDIKSKADIVDYLDK